MSERDRLKSKVRDLESIERGLSENIARYQSGISTAQRDRADAGRYSDALFRQRDADKKIRDLEGQIDGARREMSRVRTQIRGIESEIRSMR
jgi:hypothetical protein